VRRLSQIFKPDSNSPEKIRLSGRSSSHEIVAKNKAEEFRKMKEVISTRDDALKELESRPRRTSNEAMDDKVPLGLDRMRRLSTRFDPGFVPKTSKNIYQEKTVSTKELQPNEICALDDNEPIKSSSASRVLKEKSEEQQKMKEAILKRESSLAELEKANRPKVKDDSDEDDVGLKVEHNKQRNQVFNKFEDTAKSLPTYSKLTPEEKRLARYF